MAGVPSRPGGQDGANDSFVAERTSCSGWSAVRGRPDALFSAFFASAEFGCFLELGWPLPHNVLDLYAEHRNETNGEKTLYGDGLLGALALRGLAHIDAGQKDEMRRLILDQQQWTQDEKRKIWTIAIPT